MGTPKPPQIPVDPMLQQLQKTAMQQQTQAMQNVAAGDTASLLARYGARLAMGSSTPGMPTGTGLGPYSTPIMGGFGFRGIGRA